MRRFLDDQVADHTRLRRWASSLSCSFQQPYSRLADVRAARRFLQLRLRLDLLLNEDQMRWCPHPPSQLRLPRIPVTTQRACYLCQCIDGAAGVHWPETPEHVMLKCLCPQLVALRVAVRSELRDVAANLDAVDLARAAGAAVPQFDDATQLYTILRLCVGIGPRVRRAGGSSGRGCARGAQSWSAICLLRGLGSLCSGVGGWPGLTDDWVDIHRNAHRSGLSFAPQLAG